MARFRTAFHPFPATALAERTLFAYGPQTYGGGTCRHRCGARSSKPVAGFTVCGRFDSYASPPESILPYISKKFWFQKTGTEKPLEVSASRGFFMESHARTGLKGVPLSCGTRCDIQITRRRKNGANSLARRPPGQGRSWLFVFMKIHAQHGPCVRFFVFGTGHI